MSTSAARRRAGATIVDGPASREPTRFQSVSPAISLAVFAAVFYNGALAILNSHGMRQSFGTVAAIEVAILACTALYLLLADALDVVAAGMIGAGIAVSIYTTLASQAISADCARSMLIIAVFYTVGKRIDLPLLLGIFRVVTAVVLAILLLELVATDTYVSIFQPASYYANTRGIQEFSLDSSGLFRNALGFSGRFSFGLSSHRTSSLFIEQVSLANYAGVLCVFLLSLAPRMHALDRLLHFGTLILILLSNDTRTSSALAVASLIGAVVYPLLDTRACLLMMPTVLATGFVFNALFGPNEVTEGVSDDFRGRVAVTMQHLAHFDLGTLFGFNAGIAPSLMDSGYAFVIATSTVLGLLALWLILAFAVPAGTPAQRRCLFGLNLYFLCNLMIGGTAVFSIKVAAPLWLIVGFMAIYRPSSTEGSRSVRSRAPRRVGPLRPSAAS